MNTTMFQVAWAACSLMYTDVDVTPKIPLSQAVLESANFASHVYEINNNCFGMKAPTARETTCTNKGKGGYANYSSVLDCIRDYFLWCRAMGVKSDGDLDALIKSGRYAEDKKYYPKVLAGIAVLTKEKKYIDPALIIGAGVVSAGAGGLVMVKAITHILDAD